jgi:tetratricopeptide (TPR) repeat protein
VPTIAGYDVRSALRHGGQGEVFSAVQQSTGQRVAIKVLRQDSLSTGSGRRRFEREIEAIVGLRHPNIVRVFDSGVTPDERPYYVMEYIDGVPLDEYISSRPGSARQMLRLFVSICDAVAHAHQRGVVHRDLKPANIVIDDDGAPRVVDFGVAKLFASEAIASSTQLTAPDGFVGTLAYAAPEQIGGDGSDADTRSDVYALGMVLFFLLTGAYPYETADTPAEVIRAITEQTPEPPSRRCRDGGGGDLPIGDEIDTIVLKALAKDPERRYQSVTALRDDCQRYLDGRPIEAKRDSALYVLRKTLLRHKLTASLVALLTLSVFAFALAMALLYPRAVSAERLARQRLEQVSAAQRRSEDAATRARMSAARSGEINRFLREMLSAANPYASGGGDLTVAQVVGQAAKRIDVEFADDPAVAAGLHLTIGNAYRGMGRYAQAEPHLRRALDLLIAVDGEDHPDTATARMVLAALLRGKGDRASAEVLYQRAIATYRRQLGNQHPFVAHALLSLGGLFVEQGKLDAAEPLYREALQINRALHADAPHADLAFSLASIAGLSYARGDYERAERGYREALAMYRTLLGDQHAVVAVCINQIGLTLQAQSRFDEADTLFREAVDLRTRLLGPEHPDTLASAAHLGRLLSESGQSQEAERLLRRTLAARRRTLGDEHPDTLRTLNALTEELRRQGRDQEAAALLRQFEATGQRGAPL